MAVYPKAIIERWTGDMFEDISVDVVSDIEVTYGIRDNGLLDRVASVGELKFTLRNDAGCIGGVANAYTPGFNSPYCRSLIFGTLVNLKFVYRTETIYKFYGHVTGIDTDLENRVVHIVARDWMGYADALPLSQVVTFTENKKINDVVDLILNEMDFQPDNKNFSIGYNTFTSVFDTVKNRTRAIGEFQKLALSEMGYIYIRNDPYKGETLTVDSIYIRNGAIQSVVPDISAYLADESLNDLVTESGDKLIAVQSIYAFLDNKAYQTDWKYGENITNIVNSKYYPRKIDTTVKTLYTLDIPSYLPAYTTITLEVNYKDPDNIATSVAGKDMISPAETTDYLMNSLADGTGTNLTSNLSVTATYYATKVKYVLANNGATAGYITKLQARGYGIYIYDAIDYVARDNLSVSHYGEREVTLDLKYLNSPEQAKYYADELISTYPQMKIKSFNFLANADENTLMNFLYMDVGDMVHIEDDKSNITVFSGAYFYINGVSFTVSTGGIINFSWVVQHYNANPFA